MSFVSNTNSPFQEVDMTPYYREIRYHESIAPYMKALFEQLNERLCPVTLLFYRQNKPRIRKVKSNKTKFQNINSYATVLLTDFNNYGTIKRSMKHKGFGKLIALIPPCTNDILDNSNSKRIIRYSFIDLEEIRIKHDLDPNFFDDIVSEYPTKAYGQLRLILPTDNR